MCDRLSKEQIESLGAKFVQPPIAAQIRRRRIRKGLFAFSTDSVIAFSKLQGILSGRPFIYPARIDVSLANPAIAAPVSVHFVQSFSIDRKRKLSIQMRRESR
jgi:NAD/NADP transhydrogenase beta subunit